MSRTRYPYCNPMIAVLNLGHCDYSTALRLQERLVELRQAGRVPNVLLFVEHPPVITLGRNARAANIVAPAEMLAARGVEVHEINRGGDVTFHGPGQLVAYPIFDLRSFSPRLGVVDYVRLLEDVLMRVCIEYRVETQRVRGLTGVWTYATPPPRLSGRGALEGGRDYVPSGEEHSEDPHIRQKKADVGHPQADVGHPPGGEERVDGGQPWPERKIAAIGVHVARGVTSHGFALNVATDLEFFRLIVPCGLARPVTSIEFESGLRPSLEEAATCASRCFGERFGSQMLWLESIHDLLPPESADGGEGVGPVVADSGEDPHPPTAADVGHHSAAPHSPKSGADVGHLPESVPRVPEPIPEPRDTPARAPENERRIASDDIHLA